MAKNTPKPTRPPRQPKSPIIPLRSDQTTHPIGLIQEKLIGRVIVEWSKLEGCLHELIWRFAGLSFEDGRLFTERMDSNRLIALLRVLGPRKLDGSALQTFVNVLAAVDELRDDRNFIAHGTWATLEPGSEPTASSIRTKSEPGEVVAEHFPQSRMRLIVREIIKTREAAVRIMRAVPWPSE